MEGALITAIIFGGVVLSLAVVGATILMGIRLIKGGVSRKDRRMQAEDAGNIQEIYRKLTRMEERVDALETIMFDKENGRAANEFTR